ncbi:peptidase [Nocardioides antri]|uniref:peptidase n=1 Tax=Nocardioides antri TaxID=2607659 RepID=UPI00165EE901|nr:peptidase [Nocardioides antri]
MGRRQSVRVGLAVVAAATVVAAAISVPGGTSSGALDLTAAAEQDRSSSDVPHVDQPGTPPHSHHDPSTKNLISRAGFEEGTVDPTTAEQRKAATAYVERERALPDPTLTDVRAYPARTTVPQTRYAMAGACYTLQAPSGAYVVRDGASVALAEVRASAAARFYFKATRLGGYLLHTADGVLASSDGAIEIVAEPSRDADWTVNRRATGRFTFRTVEGAALTARRGDLVAGDRATGFRLQHATSRCSAYPEAGINIAGRPHGGVTSFQEVRGYVDAHTHGMAFEFLGGDVHCGRPWHTYGAPYALVDCPDHTLTQGNGAILESFLSGEPSHDPVGWPTFKDWPAPNSLTHEGTYYRWLERAWRGGQRLFVNLLVENNKMCQLYPIKHNSCDDMDSIRLQAKDMYEFQDYVDAQFGGPGLGFYRIVRTPFEARRVINAGKMAVVMGIETSIPFGCTFKEVLGKDQPACDVAEIDANLEEMHTLGVRQMELVNKFDNALSGVAGDSGEVGLFVNSANFLETASFWQMEHCEPADGESHDKNQTALPTLPEQDAIFGAIYALFGDAVALPQLPVYPPPAHCNKRGLTDLGKHLIRGLAKRHMIFDPDHMSVKARQASMDLIEEIDYPGVISSHSWSTPDTYPRIYRAGGFITPYAGDSTGFVDKWRRHVEWADPRYYWGIGFGADINGLGAQGDPRGSDVPNPVTYPFTGIGGVQVAKQRAGERVWDINVDGVAQYGLYPDWVEDLGLVADAQHAGDGAAIRDDMGRGTEAYLQMWERAVGIAPDSCRNPGLRRSVARVRSLVQPGMSTTEVMRRVGQPFRRLGRTYGVCAKTADDPRVMVRIVFDRTGHVVRVVAP